MRDFLYTPINTVKPAADEVWIVDGPGIDFGFGPFKVAFPTRMTLIRLPGGKLVVHSPTALTPDLAREVKALGEVADIVAPNKIHYWWAGDWAEAYPKARILAAPGVKERAGDRLPASAFQLDGAAVDGWGETLSYIPVTSGYMTEAVLFHHPSRTLVLTDLIENFEPERIASSLKRLLLRLGGIMHPHGSMPRDMRMTFRGREDHLRQAVRRMMDWTPERILLTHGKCYETNCRQELARAFRFVNVGN
ncbi:MAG TPA: DUF4336 domain-containing protein [Rhodospirillales bacterium]|nr:DUF4336 domain-containing protein [Rhodospirillales bacterium]